MSDKFKYTDPMPLKEHDCEFENLGKEGISEVEFEGRKILKIQPETISKLAERAFFEINHYMRTSHFKQLAGIFKDPEASENDRFVAYNLIDNAQIAANGSLPMCQDTGTAIVMGKKGQYVFTGNNDAEAISEGIYNAYQKHNLRYSQNSPISMFQEVNTKNNLPAQIEIYSTHKNEYEFLFIAKGGGSANKTFFFQETKATLNPKSLIPFLVSKIKTLETSACPPYHLAIVIGGTSAEANLKTVKLASTRYLDSLPTEGGKDGVAFRDLVLESQLLEEAQKLGIGAQFGGKYYCLDVRVIRLPRHGASCPIGIGVSCSADRQIIAKINSSGVFLEKLERNPGRFLDGIPSQAKSAVRINLNQPMSEIVKELAKYPVMTLFYFSGTIIVARDMAHARIKENFEKTGNIPSYFKEHPIYYAGPAKTPEGMASGSFGPTTAGRMDSYLELFQKQGAALITIAKGNRSKVVIESCQKNGGFYLGSTGGAAAHLAKNNITKMECIDFEDLGMEAVWKIEVKDFPAIMLIDNKGNDFFKALEETEGK